jgi:hypothetical protein
MVDYGIMLPTKNLPADLDRIFVLGLCFSCAACEFLLIYDVQKEIPRKRLDSVILSERCGAQMTWKSSDQFVLCILSSQILRYSELGETRKRRFSSRVLLKRHQPAHQISRTVSAFCKSAWILFNALNHPATSTKTTTTSQKFVNSSDHTSITKLSLH